jgi:hypothetical protein
MRLRGRVARVVAGAILLGIVGAVPAEAVTWSAPGRFDPPAASCGRPMACGSESAPRVAINPRGAAVAAWVDPRGRVRATVAGARGRFGAATTLSTRGLRPTTAMAADGTATVVWLDAHGTLRFARRRPDRHRFGTSAVLAPRGSKRGDDSPKAAAEPDGSTVVVYESSGRVRAVTISAAGRPGVSTVLGHGGFDHDTVRAAPDGTLAACCIEPVVSDPNLPPDTAQKVAVYRAGTGWTLVSAGAVGHDAIETVFGTATDLVLGTTKVAQGGDAGVLGVPSLARAGADDVLAVPLRAPVVRANHGLAPSVAIDGSGRSVLLFQEKAKARAFTRTAPVYATVAAAGATALPRRQSLDGRLGYEPAVRPLGPGAIGVWQDPGARWGVAIERDGTFHHAPAPAGDGPTTDGEDFNYAYDLEAAGTHAVLAWVARDGAVRVSELS